MASLRLVDVSIEVGGGERQFALHGVNFDIAHGEFVVLLGSSGCGKSTILRAICGLQPISRGSIMIDNRPVEHLGPAERGLAMVFQNYALYPQMTVAENMGFALHIAGVPQNQIDARVLQVARSLRMETYLSRRPGQLSGGQRQRVAIGRAIVREPVAFCFDEPLSNLDAGLRGEMRGEIKALHRRLGSTMIYVTHDQVEAMTLADRLVLFSPRGLEQIGTPQQLFSEPANLFVAAFLGTPAINFLSGIVEAGQIRLRDGSRIGCAHRALAEGRPVVVGVRPRNFRRVAGGPLRGAVEQIEWLGDETVCRIRCAATDAPLVVVLDAKQRPQMGELVEIDVAPDDLLLFDPAGPLLNEQVHD